MDVSGLPCPEPLVAVLTLIDSGEAGDVVMAHLSQEPLLLYPELDERGCRYRLVSQTGDTRRGDLVILEIVPPRR